ncbi:pyridine nucleotide-disulfide oxidoreductase domain-containing protein [Sarocladium implicatum]|nr:pyridine nucleotide-disulfide oxidoreductase domain-containing protein [Sarocladium implicatum]
MLASRARTVMPSAGCRSFATVSDAIPVSSASRRHKVAIVGAGSAGMAVSHQLLRTGKFQSEDIAIIDPAEWHHYQPGWTLVGGGLKNKEDLRRQLPSLLDPRIRLYNQQTESFQPENNTVTLGNGDKLEYEQLVVCPGININYDSVKGLSEALKDPQAPVSSIYGYDTCDKTARNIADFKKGQALFTLPAGPIKCAGGPQKIMWLALDGWKRAGLYKTDDRAASDIDVTFATALPVMFGVPKYAQELEKLRQERGVEGLFQHDLVAVEGNTAVFARPDGKEQVKKKFDLLHATPKMGPHAFIKNSSLAGADGFVTVNKDTLQHANYANVWSLGDASSAPTAKTAAAITAQTPVVIENMMNTMAGKEPTVSYNGYTSCPLLTEYGKVMLAEFKYGGVPEETFSRFVDQKEPRRAFYHLKKDFFPWVYYQSYVKGTWAGPKGWKS